MGNVESENFLGRIKELQQALPDGMGNEFPFREATGLKFIAIALQMGLFYFLVYIVADL